MSRDIVRILRSGVVGDVNVAGCPHAVVTEGPSKSAVARDYGASRRWVQKLVARYLAEGDAAFEPPSRRPHSSPRQIGQAVEEAIVGWRSDRAAAWRWLGGLG